MDVTFIDLIWVDNLTHEVRSIDGFEESWSRCPAGTTDDVFPIQVDTRSDAATLTGRWGWVQGCGSGYVEYTRDGRIWLVETNDAGEAVMDPEFDYGIFEIKGEILLEVYAYHSGTWTSETNFAFDDQGLLFFSDSLKTSWTEFGGETSQDDPFFEILFRCVAEGAETAEDGAGDATAAAGASEAALEAFLFDSDVALLVAAVRESGRAAVGSMPASSPAAMPRHRPRRRTRWLAASTISGRSSTSAETVTCRWRKSPGAFGCSPSGARWNEPRPKAGRWMPRPSSAFT